MISYDEKSGNGWEVLHSQAYEVQIHCLRFRLRSWCRFSYGQSTQGLYFGWPVEYGRACQGVFVRPHRDGPKDRSYVEGDAQARRFACGP